MPQQLKYISKVTDHAVACISSQSLAVPGKQQVKLGQ